MGVGCVWGVCGGVGVWGWKEGGGWGVGWGWGAHKGRGQHRASPVCTVPCTTGCSPIRSPHKRRQPLLQVIKVSLLPP